MNDPRWYQTRDIGRIKQEYGPKQMRSVCYTAPTGSGKTHTFILVIRGAIAKGIQVLVLCHRIELIDQIAAALTDAGCEFGYVVAGYADNPRAPVQLATIQTYISRAAQYPAPGLIIIDESHHAPSATFRRVLVLYPLAKILGVTATPCAPGMAQIFQSLVVGPTMSELIDQGYLSKYRLFRPPTVDTSGLHTRHGEYIAAETEALMNRPAITGNALEHYQRICDGVPALAFCCSIKHAQDVAAEFRSAGYAAVHMHGGMHKDVRRGIIKDYRAGLIKLVSSADILIEGVDLPGAKAGIMLRPSQSIRVHMQSIGRIMRPSPAHEFAYLIDHVNNSRHLGRPDDPREWVLDGERKAAKGSSLSDRVCPKCWMSVRSTARACECGYEFPIRPRKVDRVDGELEEETAEARAAELAEREAKQVRASEEYACRTLGDWHALAKKRGHKAQWAFHRYQNMKPRNGAAVETGNG